ncbi:MAG: hypothetical protein ACYS7M_13655, partial [Planctomycetota bacterium]
MSRSPLSTASVALPLCMLMLPGCSNKEETAEHRSLEGVIERIDVDESEVTLRYYSAKHKAETTITGKATAET